MLRIVFMGSDSIAMPALLWLAGQGRHLAEVVGVFTQPDRAAGRGQLIQPNEIKYWAIVRGLPLLQPARIGPREREQLADLKPDLTLVMAYGHLLSQDVIDTPRLGTFNLHTSVLPAFRGASPIQTAICGGESETGVSLMRMVLRLDAGPIIGVERVKIGALDTVSEVEEKLSEACVPLLAHCLPRIAADAQDYTLQNESEATYCRRLEKADGVLDFQAPAKLLSGRINGLMPWPGCAVEIKGQPVKLGLADVSSLTELNPAEPGVVIGTDPEGLLVGTGQGTLRLRLLQRPGGRMMPAAEFLRGFPVAPGTRLDSRPMPPLVAREPFPRPKV